MDDVQPDDGYLEGYPDAYEDEPPKDHTTLIVVLLVVGLAAVGTAVIGAAGYLWLHSGPGALSAAEEAAHDRLDEIAAAVQAHRMRTGALPRSLHEISLPHPSRPAGVGRGVPKDPWDRAYQYRVIHRIEFELRSLGPDGEPDTEDDITWPRED